MERMDPLEIMTQKENIVPQYNPIFSADGHVVIGYEVSGVIHHHEEKVELQHFFEDDTIPEEYRLEVEELLLRKAFDDFIETDQSFFLFVYQNPTLLLFDKEEQFFHLVQDYHKKGLDIKKLVVEITEHSFEGDIQMLHHALMYYRTYGMQLAINQVTNGNSNIKRVSILAPDILRINITDNDSSSEGLSYQDLLQSISLLAEKMGAVLLYEGIQTFYHMRYAWKNNGRYYQGTYLHSPVRAFISPQVRKEKLREEFHSFIVHEKEKIQKVREHTEKFQGILSMQLGKRKDKELTDEYLLQLAKQLEDFCFRMYICDEDGFQQSANILKIAGGVWEGQEEYKRKNWSWRPYFLENMIEIRSNQKGRLSYKYRDIGTGETIRTYSHPLYDGNYLFIDIPYEYIYTHGELL